MEFEFSPEQLAFVKEVESFLDANDDPEVFDVTRENMAQIVDTPKAPLSSSSMSALSVSVAPAATFLTWLPRRR